MYSCIIIDDDDNAVEALARHIEKTEDLTVFGKFTNPLKAIGFIESNPRPDIVFLDINMPELSGFSVAETLPDSTAIIFTTGYVEHALPAFNFAVVDFLLKPFSFEEFKKSIDKIISLLPVEANLSPKRNGEYFFINAGVKGIVVQLKFSDILYVKAMDNYVIIHTLTENHITYLTMTEIELAMPQTHFSRIHRSYIVNMNQIKIIQGNEVLLSNAAKLPLGPSFREHFIKKVQSTTLRSKR